MPHERFRYDSLTALKATAGRESAWLPFSDDISVLAKPLSINAIELRNRLAIQPMEGADSLPDGSPSALTIRRYERFAAGGAGLIWFEAVAVTHEGRANPHQLMLTEDNLDAYKRLVDHIRAVALRENGYVPCVVMQATHSGRYSKPEGVPAPRIAYNNPLYEETPLPPSCVLTDDELRRIETTYAKTAELAELAGFDGIDIKACHRYLANELLSAYNRPGDYGGSLANRSRFLINAMEAARSAISGSMFLTTRINVYDGFPHPYGFGVKAGASLDEAVIPELEEPLTLVHSLIERYSLPLINITIGNPYKNPHVNRPYDSGAYTPDEHPLVGLSRMMSCVSRIQQANPQVIVMGSAFSYPRQYAAQLAAGMTKDKHCQLAGFGRMAIAYPDFANDILREGKLDEKKICLTCGQCASLLRQGKPAGCVVRDAQYK